jgi:hypothetical protein
MATPRRKTNTGSSPTDNNYCTLQGQNVQIPAQLITRAQNGIFTVSLRAFGQLGTLMGQWWRQNAQGGAQQGTARRGRPKTQAAGAD